MGCLGVKVINFFGELKPIVVVLMSSLQYDVKKIVDYPISTGFLFMIVFESPP